MTERKQVAVAAAVIFRDSARGREFLLGQRAPGTFYPGYWEFPGGKVEPGEAPVDALKRELDEELGITVTACSPWLTLSHEYEHAFVRLHFFRVEAWQGALQDRVHSSLSWQQAEVLTVGPMLPANGPVLKSLRLPGFMAVTHAWQIGHAAQLDAIRRACALIDDALLARYLEETLDVARDIGASFFEVTTAIAFRALGEPLGGLLKSGRRLHLAGRIKADGWRGADAAQFQIADAAEAA